MSKGMIDLSRANKAAAPVLDAPAETPVPTTPIPEEPKAAPVTKSTRTRAAAPKQAAPAAPPKVETSEAISTIAARIPVSLHKAVRVYCANEDVDIQAFVRDALTRHLAMLQEGEE